ncbi:MAG: hypothetical protein KJ804_02350 [Proteobacteria bacterium]|nr:hypothetical protein [Pseudomonadota bacterium]MBU1057145.1 hypothetical protein [Pseudomonadota bacterium]
MSQENKSKQQQVKVRYTETSALYASQFILNASEEDITVNFSSGPLVDPVSGETILPVHTRIAMSKEGARRLHAILSKVLSQPAAKQKMAEAAQAQLPKMQ